MIDFSAIQSSTFLPPANEVCKGYVKVMFLHVSVCPQGGGVRGRGWGGPPCTPPNRYYEIRSMSGWYASYWNAFLLQCYFVHGHLQQCLLQVTSFTDYHAIFGNIPKYLDPSVKCLLYRPQVC